VLTIVVNFHSYTLQGELKGQKICSCRVFLRKLTCPYEDSASTNQASCLTYLPCFLIFFKSFPQTQESFTYNYLQVFFFNLQKIFFLWYRVLNSGLQACKAGTLPLEPCLQSIFALVMLEMGGLSICLPGWPCPSIL
jgi:hypothetical protein